MRDFEAYYAAGTLWNSGQDPYSQAIWRAEHSLTGVDGRRYEALPFVGPPVLLPFFGVIARVPFETANVLWRAALILTLAGLALATLCIARRRLTAASVFAMAIAALGFGPLTSALALGQIALPAFLFAALSLYCQPLQFFAWVQPNVALALLGQLVSRRAAVFAAAAAAFAACCVVATGMPGIAHYAAVLQRHGAGERFSAIQLTPPAIAYGFGAPQSFAASIGIAVAVAAVCSWVLLVRSASGSVARFCITCALLPFAMPFFHEHDLLVLFVPAVVYTIRPGARAWTPAAFGALLAATDWLGLAQRPDGTLQTLLLIGAFGLALIASNDRPRPGMLLVPASVLLLIGAASILAQAHPLPVWPDGMRALPADAARMDISQAWNAQQRATGLFDRDPVWAVLRLFSLAGCALTAAAAAASSKSARDSRTSLPAPA
jgi:hypothetical protein